MLTIEFHLKQKRKLITIQVAYIPDSRAVVVAAVVVVAHSCLDKFHIVVDLAENVDSCTDLKSNLFALETCFSNWVFQYRIEFRILKI